MEEERSDFVNNLKTFLRRWPRLYLGLIYVISPICFVGMSPKTFLRRFGSGKTILNIGSGVHRYRDDIVNIDIFPYRNVDVVADAMALPFADNSVDAALCECLLEHVPSPERVVAEMLRVLRPGGQLYIAVPFVYPFHACPNDFFRWSNEGVKQLLRNGEIEIVAPRSGPTSALVAQLVTWSAITLSFGSETLYGVLSSALLIVFFPIKFLDLIIGRFPTAIHGAGSWYAVATKR
jgi:SAM-dependent methyltransferase